MPETAKRSVFLSYASQDAEAARRVCEVLRAAGVEVWFDQNDLIGGDAWDAKIRRQIRECGLFVPVISAATQARREAYFRLEWKLGAQRTHMMAAGTPFVLPVVIDDTREPDAIVPDEFREVQWTRLAGGEPAAAFAQRVRHLCENPDGEPAAPLPRRAVAPFVFLRRNFAEGPQLATVLAQNWAEATRRWADGSLPAWAVLNAGDEEAARTLRAIVQAADLDDGQKLAVALLVLHPALPLFWQGETVSPAWLVVRPEQAGRLCASGVPGWLKRLRGDGWLAESAARRAAILAEMPRTETKAEAARVEQLVFGPVEAVEKQLRELVEECTGARDAVLDGLLKREELSLGEAVLLLAVPRSAFIRAVGSTAASVAEPAAEDASFIEMLSLDGHAGAVHGVTFSAGVRWLVSGGDDAAIITWDPQSGREHRRMTGVTAPVRAVVFGPDGRAFAGAGTDGTIRLWEVNTSCELRRLEGHGGAVLGLAFSPDGRQLASVGADGWLIVWEVWTGRELRRWRGHGAWIGRVAFAPDGQCIGTSGADGEICLCEASSGRELRRLGGPGGTVHGIAFDPTGGVLASCGGEQAVRLWDTGSGAEVAQLGGHTGPVHAVAYSPTQRWLASGGADRKILVHDLKSGAVAHALESHTGAVRCLAFSRDGRWLASGGSDRAVHVWKLTDGAGR